MKMKRVLMSIGVLVILIAAGPTTLAQFAPGESTTPLPMYKKNKKGYAILRDGTRIDGEIAIGKKQITIKGADGITYKIEDFSLKEYGLDIHSAINYSPMKAYVWKDKKVKEYLYFGSDDDFNAGVKTKPQRGFVELNSGDVVEGMVTLKGDVSIIGGFHSSNLFALDELTIIDDSGKEKKYSNDDLKGFGIIVPWNLSPAWMYKYTSALGGYSSKKKPGFAILYDGRKIEGEISLFKNFITSKNSTTTTMGGMQTSSVALPEFDKNLNIKTADGKEKFDIDLVYAYGQKGMTIASLTNDNTRTFPVDRMNFHPGDIELPDGTKKEGYLAYFPGPSNYYGIYFTDDVNKEIEIYAFDELKNANQNISEIEEFVGFGDVDVSTSKNTNINGYVINIKGEKKEGTIKLGDFEDWWCKSIEFTNEDNLTTTYGTGGKPVMHFVINMNGDKKSFVYHKGIFIEGEFDLNENRLTYFQNPFPETPSFMGKLVQNTVEPQENNASTSVDYWAGSSGFDPNKVNTGASAVQAAAYGGLFSAETIPQSMVKLAFKNELMVYSGVTFEKMGIPKKSKLGGKTEMEVLLEGCKEFHSLTKDKKKYLMQFENTGEAVQYLNDCYKGK